MSKWNERRKDKLESRIMKEVSEFMSEMSCYCVSVECCTAKMREQSLACLWNAYCYRACGVSVAATPRVSACMWNEPIA